MSQALEAVRIDHVFNWTDSLISLWWITNTNKKYKQFVENRVAEIRRNSPLPLETPLTGSELSNRAKYLTTVLSQFWRRWQKEYLTELRVHHNCQSKNRQPTVQIGNVFCIHKDKTPSIILEHGSCLIPHHRKRWIS